MTAARVFASRSDCDWQASVCRFAGNDADRLAAMRARLYMEVQS